MKTPKSERLRRISHSIAVALKCQLVHGRLCDKCFEEIENIHTWLGHEAAVEEGQPNPVVSASGRGGPVQLIKESEDDQPKAQ